MKTRNAKKTKQEITTVQFEAAMKQYANAEQRETAISRRIESEITNMTMQYKDELGTIAKDKQDAFDIVQSYCVNNKEHLFVRRRSLSTVHGIAGFRLGTPRLILAKGTNWNTVLDCLKERSPDHVRRTEEPAKDLLLADRHKEHVAPLLRELGVHVIQDELFYIETKKAA